MTIDGCVNSNGKMWKKSTPKANLPNVYTQAHINIYTAILLHKGH